MFSVLFWLFCDFSNKSLAQHLFELWSDLTDGVSILYQTGEQLLLLASSEAWPECCEEVACGSGACLKGAGLSRELALGKFWWGPSNVECSCQPTSYWNWTPNFQEELDA